MKHPLALIALTTSLLAALPASAQFQKPEDAVKYRKAALTVMGNHFGRLGAMANGRIPFDAQVAETNAQLVAELSRLPWAAFGPGTDGAGTQARPEVWSEPAKFKELSEKAMDATARLAAATRNGNIDGLKATFGATAGTCKACHDAFRDR